MRPGFTVIIPVYNGAAYLAETIESVLAQTYRAVEILILNDGSHDNSLEIAQRYQEHVHVISQPNSGVSATRNYGASLAVTEWIHFLDQDDLWTPDHLARQAETIMGNPQADVCYSGRLHLTEVAATGLFRLSDPIKLPQPMDLPQVLPTRCPFTPSAVAVRCSTFLAVGGFNSDFNGVEDWDLWLRLERSGARFVHSPKPTLHYRVHGAAATNNPLPLLKKSLSLVASSILPYLPPSHRIYHGLQLRSRLEADASILLRENGSPGSLQLMLQSLLRCPCFELRRYKIAAHMLLFGTWISGT